MQNKFLTNIFLTFLWVALTGAFYLSNIIFGFVLSYFLLWIIFSRTPNNQYFKFIPKVIAFVFFFLYELIKANFQVAYEVMTPHHNMKPGIIAVPLDVKSDIQITLLANLITLTPGSFSLDVSEDKSVMFVHSMYIKDRESFIAGIKNGFEKRILELNES